ncbi:hypothetical protein [Amycolatopsis sp. MtRt-6]|uniref:hypothetical protein n=1 Tax=Amycolatopsis sp. MtRt-6 TaxID=2792782 RepID=UPI001A8CCB21|nr:hypothetical protein [Amycolatopsis sp. MtRt-6]
MGLAARRFLVPVLATLAVALAVTGTFLPLFRNEQPFTSGTVRTVVGAWRTHVTLPGRDEISGPSAPLGAALLVGAAILLAAAILGFRRPGPAASRTTLAGAAFLLGAVGTVGTLGVQWLYDPGRTGPGLSLEPGLWLLIAAALTAMAAAALSLREPAPGRPEWADPAVAYADTTTPPSGVAITVLPPERE